MPAYHTHPVTIRTETTTVTAADEFPLADDGLQRKITAANLATGLSSLAGIINVKDAAYGAVGDGVTDDTVAIQAAIDAGPGIVTGPPGTYMASQIVIKDGVLFDGGHVSSMVLKQIAGSDKNFIVSENFATLTGSNKYAENDTEVPTWFGLKDIQIDGNKDNNSSGNGVSFYGSNMVMLGTVYVRDSAAVNIYTEGPAAAEIDAFGSFEGGYFEDVISQHAGSYGWEFVGPHNSQIKSYRCILDAGGDYGWYSHNIVTGEATAPIDNIGAMHVYSQSGNTTNRRGFWFAGGGAHVGYLNADAVNILVDPPDGPDTGRPAFEHIALNNVGRNATNNIGLEINDSGIVVARLDAALNSAAVGSTCVQWDSNFGQIGIFLCTDNSTGAGNIGLDINANGCNFPNIQMASFNGTGSAAVALGGVRNFVGGHIDNSDIGLAYTGTSYNRTNLHIDAGSGQDAVTGTPTVSDHLTITRSGAGGAGYTERHVLSATFAIDSTGIKTVTTAHVALFTPASRQIQATIVDATQTDFEADIIDIGVDATNITIKVNVVTASVTGSSTAKLSIGYDVRGA